MSEREEHTLEEVLRHKSEILAPSVTSEIAEIEEYLRGKDPKKMTCEVRIAKNCLGESEIGGDWSNALMRRTDPSQSKSGNPKCVCSPCGGLLFNKHKVKSIPMRAAFERRLERLSKKLEGIENSIENIKVAIEENERLEGVMDDFIPGTDVDEGPEENTRPYTEGGSCTLGEGARGADALKGLGAKD